MKFSICIPNFNYARYLRLTLESVQQQSGVDFEICVADNNSDDGSQALIHDFAAQDPRIKYRLNPTNVGFSDNLLAASSLAVGDWHILLSSDDLMGPGALECYQKFIGALGGSSQFAFGSACDMIDGEDANIGYLGPRIKVWKPGDMDKDLSERMGCDIYRVSSAEMMRRCLSTFYGFFNFASACYPAQAYEEVGGYLGGRMYGPDKWFHWRLLTKVDEVFFIDLPLFSYRWHAQNQAGLQQKSRALKYLVDEYRNVLETTPEMLKLAAMEPAALQQNFMEEVVAKQAFASLKNNQRVEAKRILRFGAAVYPALAAASFHMWAIKGLLLLGPIGSWAARIFKPNF